MIGTHKTIRKKTMFPQIPVRLKVDQRNDHYRSLMGRELSAALLLLLPAICPFRAFGQTAPPAIFYSDLQSGPNSGGENNNGAYVTIYGKRFGASQGGSFVTVGGGKATNYKIWSDTKVSFQLGSAAATGNIIVTTANGTSNGVPFAVRSGNIYFVATGGNDSNKGSFSAPWQTVVKAKNAMVPGDLSYIQNGVVQTSIDDYNAEVSVQSAGTAANPIALVAYPGATVTIGSSSAYYGLRTPAISGAKDYWVLAGLSFRGTAAIDLVNVTGWRIVANDFSCPNGSGQSACFHTDTTTNLAFYGNYVHNIGDAAGSIDKYYHAVYFTTNSNHIDAGWNTIVPNPNHSTTSGGCRAMQFYSTGGSDQFDLHIHDNLIHDAICDGLNFATVDPDNGTVEAYNNVIYHVGTGPDPYDGSSNYSCVALNSSSGPTNAAQIYNNTMYDCGSRGTSDGGALAIGIRTRLQNNLIQVTGSEPYLVPSWKASCSTVSGSNNLWFGAGSGSNCTTANVSANPLFVNPSTFDLHIQSASPAKDAGITVSTLKTDFDGIVRPQGSAYDIGAFEYFLGAVSVPPSNPCDLNGDGIVDHLDVAIAVNQSIGAAPCGSAALQQNGSCTVVDVQRVVNAALGQTCRVGP